MKKSLLLASAAIALFAVNANAADFQPYVGAKLRYIDMNSDMESDGDKVKLDDETFGGSIALGVKTAAPHGAFRAEFEYNAADNLKKTIEDSKLETKINSFMINGYYDIATGTAFTPYVGAGIGYANVRTKSSLEGVEMMGISDTNVAWQIGAGVAYNVTDNLAVDAGYRYVDSGDSRSRILGDPVDQDNRAHEFYVGARYAF